MRMRRATPTVRSTAVIAGCSSSIKYGSASRMPGLMTCRPVLGWSRSAECTDTSSTLAGTAMSCMDDFLFIQCRLALQLHHLLLLIKSPFTPAILEGCIVGPLHTYSKNLLPDARRSGANSWHNRGPKFEGGSFRNIGTDLRTAGSARQRSPPAADRNGLSSSELRAERAGWSAALGDRGAAGDRTVRSTLECRNGSAPLMSSSLLASTAFKCKIIMLANDDLVRFVAARLRS